MPLRHLKIHNLRNIPSAELCLSSALNIIFGENASGKTSLLESLYLLGRGKSFRTAKLESAIRLGEEALTVFGVIDPGGGPSATVGVQKGRRGGVDMRVGGHSVRSASALARTWPLQFIHPGSHGLLEGGPLYRRQYLDWGVFHVEHGFHDDWQRYRRALQQRNAALRSGRIEGLGVWDRELAVCAEHIHGYREAYMASVTPRVQAYVGVLLEKVDVTLDYQAGWIPGGTLRDQLAEVLPRDRHLGYTSRGPHRAEIGISSDGLSVMQSLSRGQQKLLVIALYLAQAAVLLQRTGQGCCVLIDDLPAELDASHRKRLSDLLAELGVQVFVTAIDPHRIDSTAWSDVKRFHVEQGRIAEV